MLVAVAVQQHNSGHVADIVTAGIMWHWLFWKALLTGYLQRPNTFNYYLTYLTIIPSTGSTLHRFWELRKQKYIYVNKRTR